MGVALPAFSPSNDPIWLVGNLIAVAAIGVMIYFGYKWINGSAKGKGKKK